MAVRTFSVASRLVLAIGGGYVVSAGLTALAAIALPATTGLPSSEATVLASMLAFLAYLALLIWAFAEPNLSRLCAVMIAACTALRGGTLGFAHVAG